MFANLIITGLFLLCGHTTEAAPVQSELQEQRQFTLLMLLPPVML